MRSTTGKLIRFTLQRTPTWAWGGLVWEPVYLLEAPKYGPGILVLAEECYYWNKKFINELLYNGGFSESKS